MPRQYHYFCPLCNRTQDEGQISICPRCENDTQAVLLVYHKMIAKWPRLSELTVDKAFEVMLKRLVKLEGQVKSTPDAAHRAQPDPKKVRSPDGFIDNCALANRDFADKCQVCDGNCPDAHLFITPT